MYSNLIYSCSDLLRLGHFRFFPVVVTIYTLCFVSPLQSGTAPLMSTLCSSSRTFQECVQSLRGAHFLQPDMATSQTIGAG